MAKLSLEDELKNMGIAADAVAEGAKASQSEARRIKKNSKDLTDQLTDMKDRLNSMAGAAQVWQSMGNFGAGVRRERRNSKDLTEDLRKAFNELDEDGSGELDKEEVKGALQKANPSITDEEVDKMIAWADLDGNGARPLAAREREREAAWGPVLRLSADGQGAVHNATGSIDFDEYAQIMNYKAAIDQANAPAPAL
jgi:hypothetical protein|eukprot:4780731-Prymnesium_polylepis.2